MHPISASSMRRLAVLSVAGLVAACGDSNAPGYVPTSANIVGTPIPATSLDSAELKLCKFGSAGTFTVTVNGTASQVTLQDGECQQVGTSPRGGVPWTITENSDPATVFDSVEQFRTVNKTMVVYEISFFTSTVSGTINGDVGRLVEFFNHPAPPPPPPGCTLTQGFWKTHASDWPSGSDPNSTFFLSGNTWIGVLGVSPQGNAYYILAKQYIAAVLNGLGGASAPANVQAAIAGAGAYFAANAPTPAPSGATRTQLTTWGTLLDNYNRGVVGPGHCGGVADPT